MLQNEKRLPKIPVSKAALHRMLRSSFFQYVNFLISLAHLNRVKICINMCNYMPGDTINLYKYEPGQAQAHSARQRPKEIEE